MVCSGIGMSAKSEGNCSTGKYGFGDGHLGRPVSGSLGHRPAEQISASCPHVMGKRNRRSNNNFSM
jgi:hypothetical protein